MSTTVRPEVSSKNKYWISRHRYYELKHYCLQYPEWKKLYSKLEQELLPRCVSEREKILLSEISNPTERIAILRMRYKTKMDLIERIAKQTDPELSDYILRAVTENIPYTYFKTMEDIPCSKDTFYDRYRKFFFILSSEKDECEVSTAYKETILKTVDDAKQIGKGLSKLGIAYE